MILHSQEVFFLSVLEERNFGPYRTSTQLDSLFRQLINSLNRASNAPSMLLRLRLKNSRLMALFLKAEGFGHSHGYFVSLRHKLSHSLDPHS